MLTYIEGTVFNAPVKTFVNTVNCAGVMGAGIALEFKLRYPEMFDDYVQKCNDKKMKVGIPRIYEYSKDVWIMNFPTKGHWRFPSKIQWIEEGLKYFAENYKKRDIESIAFPKLGTNNGGLNWDDVKALMEKYLKDLDMNVYICLDEKHEAEGTEKVMIDILNELTLDNLVKDVELTKKQAQKVIENLPYNRMWHLSKVEGITGKTYEKIFNYLYQKTDRCKNISSKSENEHEDIASQQLSLF